MRQRWTEAVEDMNFTRSSREAWSLLRKLGDSTVHAKRKSPISPDQVANQIIETSRAPREKRYTVEIKRELRTLRRNSPTESDFSRPFTEEEVTIAIKDVKPGKAPGLDTSRISYPCWEKCNQMAGSLFLEHYNNWPISQKSLRSLK